MLSIILLCANLASCIAWGIAPELINADESHMRILQSTNHGGWWCDSDEGGNSCDKSCDRSCNRGCDKAAPNNRCDLACDGGCNAGCDTGCQMCECYGGGVMNGHDLPSYLEIPEALEDGTHCVGGCGNDGQEFRTISSNAPYSAVKEISFWNGGERGGFKAIRMSFFDDSQSYTLGSPTEDWDSHCTFAPGEMLTGDLTISGNTDKSIVTYFHVQTSHMNTCSAGNEDKGYKYLFPTRGTFLGGLRGSAGDQINQLAPLFWKPILKVELSAPDYPTFQERGLEPQEIISRPRCNSLPIPESVARETITNAYTTKRTKCWKVSAGFEFGVSYTYQKQITVPEVSQTTHTTSVHMVLSASFEHSACTETTDQSTRTLEFPAITVAPHTSFKQSYMRYEGRNEDLPFTTTVTVHFDNDNDGVADTTLEYDAHGVYNGVVYSEVYEYLSDYQEGVMSC